MTMQAFLINAGNRTSDRLVIEKRGTDGVWHKTVVDRGSKVDIYSFLGHSAENTPEIRMYIEDRGLVDEYMGNPVVTVAEVPKAI